MDNIFTTDRTTHGTNMATDHTNVCGAVEATPVLHNNLTVNSSVLGYYLGSKVQVRSI